MEALRTRARNRPGLNLSKVGSLAIECWLKITETPEVELVTPDGRPLIKAANAPFPVRLEKTARAGRPALDEQRTQGGEIARAKLYVAPQLAERLYNASWWRSRYPGHDVADALAQYLTDTASPNGDSRPPRAH